MRRKEVVSNDKQYMNRTVLKGAAYAVRAGPLLRANQPRLYFGAARARVVAQSSRLEASRAVSKLPSHTSRPLATPRRISTVASAAMVETPTTTDLGDNPLLTVSS